MVMTPELVNQAGPLHRLMMVLIQQARRSQLMPTPLQKLPHGWMLTASTTRARHLRPTYWLWFPLNSKEVAA